MNRFRERAGPALLIVVVTVVAYLPALRAGFIWDDDTLLTDNILVRSGAGLFRFWFTTQSVDYWPVTMSAFWAQWRLWGLHPAGYHAVNVALHALEALLFWGVLRRLGLRHALLGAALFVVHPVNVETVAWVSELKNLMAMLFFLLSIRSFLATELWDPQGCRGRGTGPSLLFFTLGMLSKGSVAILPVVLLGLVAWRRRPAKADIVRLVPFVVVATGLVLVDVWFQRHGSGVVIRQAGPVERLLGAAAAAWFYLGKALWPVGLSFVYPQWTIRAGDPAWWLPLAAAVLATVVLWRSRASAWGRALLFAWAYFIAALLPVMGFVDVYFMKYSLVADHYQHLALLGVAGVVAAAWERVNSRAAAVALVAALAVLTFRQASLYRDSETLYRATLAENPRAWIAHTNLGVLLTHDGRAEEAIGHLRTALELKPGLPDAELDLGAALAGLGRTQEALPHLREAVQGDPRSWQGHFNLGLALVSLRRFGEAVPEFERVVALKPDHAMAELDLGDAWSALGKPAEAVPHYERALGMKPDIVEARSGLGDAFTQLQRLPEAAGQYAAACALQPSNPGLHNNLGCTLALLGRTAEARREFEAALRLKPDYAEARANLERLGQP
jgi:protein O-mannosyl-transferase